MKRNSLEELVLETDLFLHLRLHPLCQGWPRGCCEQLVPLLSLWLENFSWE